MSWVPVVVASRTYLSLIPGKLCVLGLELNVEEIVPGLEDVRLQFVQLALVGQALLLRRRKRGEEARI